MRVISRICDHASGPVRMKRIYKRIKKGGSYAFVPGSYVEFVTRFTFILYDYQSNINLSCYLRIFFGGHR